MPSEQPRNRPAGPANALPNLRRPDPDAELVVRAQAGDELALKELHDRHCEGVFAICLQALKDEGRAADCATDSLTIALRNIKQFRGRSKFFTWLVCIARRRIARTISERVRERGAEAEPATAPSPETIRNEQQAYITLVTAMQHLPPDQARIFNLCFLAGLSRAETARALGLSEESVRAALSRGRARLREVLKL
jgi:RNA polymerase sigma-70 factor (ECF subfamily)